MRILKEQAAVSDTRAYKREDTNEQKAKEKRRYFLPDVH